MSDENIECLLKMFHQTNMDASDGSKKDRGAEGAIADEHPGHFVGLREGDIHEAARLLHGGSTLPRGAVIPVCCLAAGASCLLSAVLQPTSLSQSRGR